MLSEEGKRRTNMWHQSHMQPKDGTNELIYKTGTQPQMHWVGQKVHSGFSITFYRKTQMNFFANSMENNHDCKQSRPIHPKDQSWVFTGGTDVEAGIPILWPPDAKS